MIAPVMNTAFATDNGWAKICRWTLIHVCTMCTEKEDLLTVYFWVWREGLRQQLHLLHCTQLNGWNLCKQIFWTSGHQCCKESWQNGMKSRHSQETVIKFALEGKKVAPANMCWCAYMDATTLLRVCIYTVCCCCSVTQSCQTLCHPMDCIIPGFPVLHHLPELAQTHVPCDFDAI